MKVLVTGEHGQLGSELKELVSSFPDLEFIFVDRVRFPLDDSIQMKSLLDLENPDIVINAGAYTSVDMAEKEQAIADRVNHLAPSEIAIWCRAHGARLVHISTDYVFDGSAEKPLSEDALKSPINAYGISKHLGEEAVLAAGADAMIIRTAWVFSSYGKNFVKTMVRLMNERASISVVNDQIGSPTYARDLAQAILSILAAKKWVSGIYHYSNEGELSWYEFALAIRDIKKLACSVEGIPSTAYSTPARRPQYSLLDKRKITNTFGIEIPHWKTSLEICLAKL